MCVCMGRGAQAWSQESTIEYVEKGGGAWPLKFSKTSKNVISLFKSTKSK